MEQQVGDWYQRSLTVATAWPDCRKRPTAFRVKVYPEVNKIKFIFIKVKNCKDNTRLELHFVGNVESTRVLMRLCDWDETTKTFVPAPYLERRSIVAYFWVKLFNQPLSLWPFEVTHSENSSFFPSTNSINSINSNCSQQDTSNFGSTRLNKRVNCVNKAIGMITLEIDQLILFATGYEKYEQFRYAISFSLHLNGV